MTVAMETTSNTRTLRAYVNDLLQTPRWIIQREVDFTDCPFDSHYNVFLPECVNCQFGKGCRWLDQQRTPKIDDAPLDELIQALESAIGYLQSTTRQSAADEVEARAWMRNARRFLRARR